MKSVPQGGPLMATRTRSVRNAMSLAALARTEASKAIDLNASSVPRATISGEARSASRRAQSALTSQVRDASSVTRLACRAADEPISAQRAILRAPLPTCIRTSAWRTRALQAWAILLVSASTANSPALSAQQGPKSAQPARKTME